MTDEAEWAVQGRVTWRSGGAFDLDAELHVAPGITGILGRSGAGKTTLLDSIAGLRSGASGQLHLAGAVVLDSKQDLDLPPESRRIGYVFQHGRLFPHLTVRQNLLYGFRLVPRRRRSLDVEAVARLLDLESLLGRWPSKLSGGERQRVALGRALLCSPRVLLLDEPLAAVDVGRRREALELLGRVHRDLGISMLMVSHGVADILALTRQVVLVDGGRVVGQGDLFDVLHDERALAVAHGLGLDNTLRVQVDSHDRSGGVTVARLGEQRLFLPQSTLDVGATGWVTIGPGDILLARADDERDRQLVSAQNALRGVVREVLPMGGHLVVIVDVGQPLRVEITQRARETLKLEVGTAVLCMAKTFSFSWPFDAL